MEADALDWVLVCGGFHFEGGMDRANAALAAHLTDRGARIHLVTHRVDETLRNHPRVCVFPVPRYGGFYFASDLTLDRRARRVAARLRASGARVFVVANGGNCSIGDLNWVHSVHHAWPCRDAGAPAWFRAKNRIYKAWARRRERTSIRTARVVVANSERTRADLVSQLGIPEQRVKTVYLGSAPAWRPPDPAAHELARRVWCGDPMQPLIVFVGALGHDVNKGVDRLLQAWRRLCAEGWRGELVIAGPGARDRWERMAAGVGRPVRFVGHTPRVGELFDAADLLVSPVHYEAYGLAAHEAICRGVPIIISARAGIAERLPREFDDLLLRDPDDVDAIVARMRAWAIDPAGWRARTLSAAGRLRAFSEDDMAAHIVSIARTAA